MTAKKIGSELFGEELETLRTAKLELSSGRHSGNPLREGYRKLADEYERLLRQMDKVLRISDTQSLAIVRMETENRALLDNAGQGFLMLDDALKVQKQFSMECLRIFGRKIAGEPFPDLVWPNEPDTRYRVEGLLRRMLTPLGQAREIGYAEGLPAFFERDGRRYRIEYKPIALPADDGSDESRVMIVLTDETEQHQSRERLEYLSMHDTLTGLRNRNSIDKWISDYRKDARLPLSLIMADMNGLKLVNDVFGHLQGDELLIRGSRILRAACGEDAVCARWGGDEFLVVLPGADAERCRETIARLYEAFKRAESFPIKISMAIGSATMSRAEEELPQLFLRAEKELYKKKLIESRSVRKKLVEDISESMYASGIENPAHVERIGELAAAFAERLGIPPGSPQMSMLQLLARLHDVGKIALPSDVVLHPGPLTAHQWEVMRTHSEIGYRLAFSLGEPALAEAILSMHERWDGTGYPYGLQGEQIPEMSRLLAVVDAYDVMTHDQPYRTALDARAALRQIDAAAGSQFDPELAMAFVDWMQERIKRKG